MTVMAGAIIYGAVSGGFGDDASAMWALPWGRVALIDLYAGLLIFGAWIMVRETNYAKIGFWLIALATLGNFAAGAYLVKAVFSSSDKTELLTGKSA